MLKRILFTVFEFAAFLGLLFVGGNWDVINLGLQVRAMQSHTQAFNPIPVIKYPVGAHILIADGILFAAVLLLVILIVQVVRKTLRNAPLTLAAFVLAVLIALTMKMGLVPA